MDILWISVYSVFNSMDILKGVDGHLPVFPEISGLNNMLLWPDDDDNSWWYLEQLLFIAVAMT